ncbi:MAG: phosphate signaling complex protein PhoU, partial [Anaerovoracaceae bacterium]
ALTEINEKILKMTAQVELDIKRAVESIKNQDMKLAKQIIDSGDIVDDLEDEINEECFLFLATQAPLASDLRYTISVMKLIRDLERIGDHCEDLAKYTLRLEGEDYEVEDIPRMAELASAMVRNAIKSFLERDLRLARKVWKADEEVDEIFRTIYKEEMDLAATSKNAKVNVNFIFVAAHLERIADYATNICEETVFSLEGEYKMEL